MAKRIPAEAGKTQLFYENILRWFAFGIGTFHVSLSILYYFFESLTKTLRKVEKWAVLAFFIAAVFYLIYTKTKYPRLMPRIRTFLKELFRPEMILLALIFVWFLICTISADGRYTANFFEINDMYMFNVFVDAFILFPMAFYLKDREKAMGIAFGVLTAIMSAVMIWVLWNVLHLNIINLPDGGQIGMTQIADDVQINAVRLSMNCHPNTTGAFSEVIMLLCLLMGIKKKGIVRWLYFAAFALHFVVMIMANSRACLYACVLALMLVAGKAAYNALGKQKTTIRLLAGVAAAGFTAWAVLLLRDVIFTEFENITHMSAILKEMKAGTASSSAASSAATAAAAEAETENAARELTMNVSGRNVIWKAAIDSVFSDLKHIICGVTPAGVISEVSIHSDGRFQEYAHNQFLEIAVSLGIPGLIAYCVWLYKQARYCILDTLKKPKAYLPAVMLMLVAANMMESTLMFYWFLPESVFFLVAGVITYLRKKENI